MEITIFYHVLEMGGGGELPHFPKFPNDFKRGGESIEFEINPVFTILVIVNLPSYTDCFRNFIDM